ncbi:MAG: DUF4445 domain-containing protein [Methylovulum sp.]|nr:MAG: DUF4445 domain-containing protein [Methylovulum sp.]
MNDPASPQQQPGNDAMNLLVRSDAEVLQLPLDADVSVRQALDATGLRVRAACGGLGTCGACLIQVISGDFNPPTLAERQKILPEDLAAGMRLACQLHARSAGELYLQHPAPHSEWKSLETSSLYRADGNAAMTGHVYGVAVDLGTSHIRLSLWNRQSGRRIGSRYSINPQVARGADVLTRLDAARSGDHDCRRLTQLARDAIIDGVRDILSRDMGEVSAVLAEIGKVLIVGNTAMLALICGNDGDSLCQPENWQRPVACRPDDIGAWRSAWRVPHAEISIVQPLAGFIGSDLLAGLVATAITEQPQPMLLADFGTNTEIALWDGQTLWTTSVPGGPAFEGVGMRNGLAAETGAICRVSKDGGRRLLQTIGEAPVRGYCASGFIDAIALLLDENLLKPSGRFTEPQPKGGYWLDAANPRTAIAAGDIDIFQRAKASTAAAMAQLLAFAGLQANDLQRLWICGSFGQHLGLHSAMRVGLLPSIEPGRVRLFADASLAGCEKLLLEPAGETLLNAVVDRAHAVNLGGVYEYEERFIDNLRLQAMPTTEYR